MRPGGPAADMTEPGVTAASEPWRAWLRDVWQGDPDGSDLRMQGEHRVARTRFLLVATLTIIGLAVVIVDPANHGYRRSIPLNLICLVLAFGVLLTTRRGTCPRWLGFASSAADVTVVSLLHVAELLANQPSMAVNGRVTFAGYFLSLVGTTVRWDRRVPVAAGVVAAAQYLVIAAWGAQIWPASGTPDVVGYGQFDWGVQIERVVLLLLFAGICWSITDWSIRLRESATHDALTGLLNRRSFEGRLRDELLLAARQREPVSVAVIDVDHFKQVNDAFGHDAGDHALRALAVTIQAELRRTDSVARWGGEEITVILPGANAPAATTMLERIRARVADQPLHVSAGLQIRLTISVGIATAPADGSTQAVLVQAADERLFEAKRAGRNRVVAVDATAGPKVPSPSRWS